MNQPNNQQNSSSLILPPGHAAGGKIITRRNFLKLAGASALALPFLKPQEACAASTHTNFIPGVSDGHAGNYQMAGIPIYSVHHYTHAGVVPTTWPRYYDSSSGTWTRVLLTCTPNWLTFKEIKKDKYSTTGYRAEWEALAAAAKPGDMISCYQEPENIHHKDAYGYSIYPYRIREFQQRMLDIAKGTNMRVGAIAFFPRYLRGGWFNSTPTDFMVHGLDWVGLDCYRRHIGIDEVQHALGAYARYAQRYCADGWSISVPECNTPAEEESKRAAYFLKVADFISDPTRGGSGYRGMFSFWNDSGPDSGPWTSKCCVWKGHYDSSCWIHKHDSRWRVGASQQTKDALYQVAQMH